MKYIIMCGGDYCQHDIPKQLIKINGEEIVARTIRLLREQGEEDIAISANNDAFAQFDVPLLKHANQYTERIEGGKIVFDGSWLNAFYPTDEPTTYLFGDVVYSPEAIRTIRETETDDIELFGSAPPYDERYIKPWQEPFAFKVINTNHLRQAIVECKVNANRGKFWRPPIAWELWATVKHGRMKGRPDVYEKNYTVINDYTCDIDSDDDIPLMEKVIAEIE